MGSLRIGTKLGLGLFAGFVALSGVSLWHCSFYLPARTVCTDLGCSQGDQGPADLAPDPSDPSKAGPYAVATLPVQGVPSALADQLLLAPSDDGAGISSREPRYPLVLVAPPQSVPLAAMRRYADRLVTHGFIVGLYQVTDQSDQNAYRDAGLAYLKFVLESTDLSIRNKIDSGRLGLMGHQLGAKISVAMAEKEPRIGALFLIDPADLLGAGATVNGVAAMGQVTLPAGAAIAILGEPLSTTNPPECIQPPQKGYADFYGAAKPPALAVTFGGANLGDFIEGFSNQLCTAGSTKPPAQTQALAQKYAAAYFQWTLKGQARAREYLLGNDFVADAAAAMLTRQSK